jgi:hypothetical protein
MLLTDSVVRRHMKGTSNFTLLEKGSSAPFHLPLDLDEAIIGWYRNPEPWQGSLLIFTSNAIWITEGEKLERVAMRTIVGYEDPETKVGVTGLRVRTSDGFRFMRVAGSYGPAGKYKDFIGLMMVIRAIINSASVP